MSELKPCPFCGGNNVIDEPVLQVVICMDCGAEMDTDLGDWNTRPIEDALNARIIEVTNLYLQTKDAFDVATEILLKQDVRIAELERDKKGLRGIEENLREHIDIGTRQLSVATARIAKLEEFIGKLIEVGHKSVNFVEGFCNTYGNERPKYWHDWKALEDGWKERE